MLLHRWFAGLDFGASRLPVESTILRFPHSIEEFCLTKIILTEVNATAQSKGLLLRGYKAVDATSIAAQSSTNNDGGARDPEMHPSKKEIHQGRIF